MEKFGVGFFPLFLHFYPIFFLFVDFKNRKRKCCIYFVVVVGKFSGKIEGKVVVVGWVADEKLKSFQHKEWRGGVEALLSPIVMKFS